MKRVDRALLGMIAMGLAGSAGAVSIDFELGAQQYFLFANPLRNEYSAQGVAFTGTAALDGGAVLSQLSNFGIGAHSGTDFLAFNHNPGVVMANGGRPVGPETLTFGSAMSSVSIWAGSGLNATFTIEAFDALGASLGSQTLSQNGGSWVQIGVAAAGIRSARISSTVGQYVFDDLNFSAAPVPEPATLVLALGALGAAARRRRASLR